MPNDPYEHVKMLLNVNKNAKIVIECELLANVRFLAVMNARTQMNAYFLVMKSKRCICMREYAVLQSGRDCRSFSNLKTLTGCRSFSHSDFENHTGKKNTRI